MFGRKQLIKLITFLAGLYFFLEFLLPENIYGFEPGKWHEQITLTFQAVGASAFALGLVSIVRHHGVEIIRLRKNFLYSSALLLGLFIMLFVTSADWYQSEKISNKVKRVQISGEFANKIITEYKNQVVVQHTLKQRTDLFVKDLEAKLANILDDHQSDQIKEKINLLNLELTKLNNLEDSVLVEELQKNIGSIQNLAFTYQEELLKQYNTSWIKHAYRIIFDGLFAALGSAMFSLLGFYIASAAYRAFRIYSLEASLMMLAALIVMLGQISFGPMIWSGFPSLRHWLLTVPNTAAFRAIEIGTAVAAIVISFRMWLSIESDNFGAKK